MSIFGGGTAMKGDLKHWFVNKNPVFTMGMGLCPAIAVTTNVKNALCMGFCTLCVLFASTITVSIARKWIHYKVRIPCFLLIISMWVTIADIILTAKFPHLRQSLGIFVPLMAVNCIVLNRADSFASKNNLKESMIDAISTGSGFLLVLVICGFLRELIGSNKILGISTFGHFQGFMAVSYAFGGFFCLALLFAALNAFKTTGERK